MKKKMRSYINLTIVFLNPLNVESKRIYCLSKILEFKKNAKKTWGTMKELIVLLLKLVLVIEKKE